MEIDATVKDPFSNDNEHSIFKVNYLGIVGTGLLV